jgi:AcrR family transcriptional regulator
VGAARELFNRQGYAATSIAQIAEKAQVGTQTIYDSLGSKRAIVLALVDLVQEEAGVGELARAIMTETSASRVVGLEVRLTRQIQERCGDIIAALHSAAPVEPDVRDALDEGNRRHRLGAAATVARLVDLGRLRPGLDPDIAIGFVDILTSAESYTALIARHGWSFDQCEARITDVLQRQLLGHVARRSGG